MTNSSISEIPQSDARDRLYNLAIIVGALLPLPGIPEIIGTIVKAPIEKRWNDWFQSLADVLETVMKTVDGLTPEKLSQNEVFVTTVIEATHVAQRTHQKEKHEALRNAVLNAALPNAPDEIRQKMFIQWLHEFTPWHIKVLRVFQSADIWNISLDLDDQEWMINIGLDKLGRIIEAKHPEMVGYDRIYIQIIKELHLKGLIANRFPEMGLAAEISSIPKSTPLATEFLDFIKPPLDVG